MIIIINICWGPVFSHETFTIMLTVARARLWLFWFPLYRWENWGSESVGNLPKAQTLGSVKGRSCCILHSLQHSLAWGSESGQAVSGQRQSLLLMHAEQGAIAGSRVVRGPMNIAAWEEDPLREGGMDGWDRGVRPAMESCQFGTVMKIRYCFFSARPRTPEGKGLMTTWGVVCDDKEKKKKTQPCRLVHSIKCPAEFHEEIDRIDGIGCLTQRTSQIREHDGPIPLLPTPHPHPPEGRP